MKKIALLAAIVIGLGWQLFARVSLGQTIESMPPVVVKTVPEAGSVEVAAGVMEIRVTFSKEMADGSWSWSTAWKGSTPEIIGKPRYDADHRTAVLKAKLEPGKTYGYWLNSEKFQNFRDKQGHAAVPYLLAFHTGAGATTAPASGTSATRPSTDAVIVEDLAREFMVALRDKDDAGLKKMASSRINKWPEAVPHIALELREKYRELAGRGDWPVEIQETLLSGTGDMAAVKVAGPAKANGAYLVLFFIKSGQTGNDCGGWRNLYLQNSPPNKPLQEHLDNIVKGMQAELARDFSHVVKFQLADSHFDAADGITISEVRGPSETMEVAGIYQVTGTCTLGSRDQATLAAYVTTELPQDREDLAKQTQIVGKGRSDFTLDFYVPKAGWPHVSFYPVASGESLGGVYFGCGEHLKKEESKEAVTAPAK